MKSITIHEIENLLEVDAMAAAIEKTEIKGHNVYFVDLGGAFGYSALVFCNCHHIKYANDYELHHPGKTREELKQFYIASMNRKLYTEQELAEPLKSYDEYTAKAHFLHSFYGEREYNVSMFGIFRTKADEEAHAEKIKGLIFNPVCYCYHKRPEFVRHCVELAEALEKRLEETKNDYEYQKSAFYYELGNHEYHINTYQGDWDTLSAFGNIKWAGQGKAAREQYFNELNFTETQRRAFEDARRQFLRDAAEKGWY